MFIITYHAKKVKGKIKIMLIYFLRKQGFTPKRLRALIGSFKSKKYIRKGAQWDAPTNNNYIILDIKSYSKASTIST